MTRPHVAYACVAVFSSVFSIVSLFVKEKLYIGESMVAGIFGIIVGPVCLNWFNPFEWGNSDIITLEITRIVLCLQIFAVAVELPRKYMLKHWLSIVLLLIPVMTTGWLIIGLFIWIIIPDLSFSASLVISACITATDPILAQSVVSGKFAQRVPGHLRNLLSAESGCNDGLAFPFIYLSLDLVLHSGRAGYITKNWICVTILYECVFGSILGIVIGYVGRLAIRFSEEHNLIDRESFLAFYVVLAFMCAGFGSMLGVDDLLVSFAAGAAFAWDGWFATRTEESNVSTVIDVLLNYAYFVYFGAIVPWHQFNEAELGTSVWRLIILAIIVIFLRRIPAVMLLKPLVPDIKTWREALFVGHFGPIGVGAVFAAILARGELETSMQEEPGPLNEIPPKDGTPHWQLIAIVWPVTCFFIVTSIIVHGSSVAIITLGRHLNTITLTKTFTTHTTNGNGKSSWMQRLPTLDKTGRSFSLHRIDSEVKRADSEDEPDYDHDPTEEQDVDEETSQETSTWRPLAKLKQRSKGSKRHRKRDIVLKKGKEILYPMKMNNHHSIDDRELNDLGRERLQREREARAATFALSGNLHTDFDIRSHARDMEDEYGYNEKDEIIQGENENITTTASTGSPYTDHDRFTRQPNIDQNHYTEEEEEEDESDEDHDHQSRLDSNSHMSPNRSGLSDVFPINVLKLDRSHTHSSSFKDDEDQTEEKHHKEQIIKEENKPTVAYKIGDKLVFENKFGEIVKEADLNELHDDEDIEAQHIKLHLSKTKSNESAKSTNSLKRVLSPPGIKKIQSLIEGPKAGRYMIYKMGNQLIIENKEGEVVRRYEISHHKKISKPEEQQGPVPMGSAVVSKALDAIGLKRSNSRTSRDTKTPISADKTSSKGSSLAPRNFHGTVSQSRYKDPSPRDTNDENDLVASHNSSQSHSRDNGTMISDTQTSEGENFETDIERQRRLNALGRLPVPRDDEDDEEEPLPAIRTREGRSRTNSRSTLRKMKESLNNAFKT